MIKKVWLCGLMLGLAATMVMGDDKEPAGVADPVHYLSKLSALLNQGFPRNRTVNIVCHGHSVPAGYAKTPHVDTFNAYPHLLHQALKGQYSNAVINVIVTAIGGENSERGSQRFETDVLALHPDLITIDYALNDRHLGLEKARVAWSSMIVKAKSKGIKVILFTPTGDAGAKLADANDPLNQHAEQIRALAAQYGVGLVDSLAAFKAYVAAGGQLKDLMSQVNHPNRKGHDLVVTKLLEWFPDVSSK